MDPKILQELLQDYHKSGSQSFECIEKISSALKKRDLQLVTLVEKLGLLLSSEEKSNRLSGLSVLVLILQETGHEIFNEQEVESLLTFFCSRLSDHHDLLPMALQGLVVLSSFPHLKESQVEGMIKSIFSEVPIAAQLQDDRRKIYSIISNLLDFHISGLQLLGSEFLLSYIQMMDGERDPRCLILAFRIVTILTTKFDLGELVEDLFEVVACYFPVDFRAPVQDPFGVSRDELSEALEICLASTGLFAPFCLPLILEKLNSDVDSAKLESLSALKRCSSSYGSINLKSELKNIWSAIRREIYSGRDETISKACLECLTAVVSSLTATENEVSAFVDTIWRECSRVIQGDSELSVVSSSILRAVFSGVSTSHRRELLDKAVVYMSQVLKDSEPSQRPCLLQALSILLDIPSLCPPGTWDCCGDCWSLLVSLLTPEEEENGKLHNSSNYIWLSVRNLLLLGCALPVSEATPLIQRIFTYISQNNCTTATKKAVIEVCTVLVKGYPEFSQTHLIPGLLQLLSSGFAVEALAAICSTNRNTATRYILDPLMQKLTDHSYETAFCKCVESLSQSQRSVHQDNLLDPYLHHLLHEALLDTYEHRSEYRDRPLYYAIEAIVAVVSPEVGQQVARDLLLIVFSNKTSVRWKDVTPTSFESLSIGSQSSLSHLLRSVLPHLPPSSESCPFHEVIPWLIKNSQLHNNQKLSQTVAGLANKCSICGQLSFDVIQNAEVNSNLILSLVWITKALLLSSHPSTKPAIEMLLSLLSNPEHGQAVAKEFETILMPVDRVLKSSSHSRIALFYTQRFFTLTAHLLLQSYHQEKKNPKIRGNFLSALCCQLKYLPLPVLKQELPSLLPILVATLEHEQEKKDLDLLLSSLDALSLLLGSENAHLASSHLTTLIPRLTELASDHNFMKVRTAALKCLYELSSLPTSELLIYAADVLRALRSCLDDKKRLVRKEAARTSCQWHLIGQETNE